MITKRNNVNQVKTPEVVVEKTPEVEATEAVLTEEEFEAIIEKDDSYPLGVDNPTHYAEADNPFLILDKDYKKGDIIELQCIDVIRNMPSYKAMPIKYLWREGLKIEYGYSIIDMRIKDLSKARWYIDNKLEELKKFKNSAKQS